VASDGSTGPRVIASAVAVLAIIAIVVIAFTTRGLPPWVALVILALLAVAFGFGERRTRALAAVVLESLRAKGPMTVTQVGIAIDRPHARVAIISALARLRSRGAVTRTPLEAESENPRDTHLYRAA
jgi:nitrate/nitrite transporter NarK